MKTESKKICLQCHFEISPDNNGISINNGDFYQCDDCHLEEFGYHIYPSELVYQNKK